MSYAEWSPAAEVELTEIVLYIAEKEGKRDTAFRIYEQIRDKCEEYGQVFHSGNIIGTERPEFGADYRTFTVMRWVVVFRPTDDGIFVAHVVDGSQDYPSLFNR